MPKPEDECLGAVVCKNPGSASAPCGLQPINPPDVTLQNIKSFVGAAYLGKYGSQPATNKYVQVLNLFYLREQDLDTAIRRQKLLPYHRDSAEERTGGFPWIWFAWGDDHEYLNQFKTIFSNKTTKPVFLNKKISRCERRVPCQTDFAKHPQGMNKTLMVSGLQQVI
jgi:hypothetical protein